MHDFDPGQLERQNEKSSRPPVTFTVRGEEFTVRPNVPFQVVYDVAVMTTDTSGMKVIQTLVENVKLMIENLVDLPDLGDEESVAINAYERWDRICDPSADFPLTFEDIVEISNWLTGQAVNRPTEPPSESQAGQPANGNGSTATSSSELDAASTA